MATFLQRYNTIVHFLKVNITLHYSIPLPNMVYNCTLQRANYSNTAIDVSFNHAFKNSGHHFDHGWSKLYHLD